MNSALIVLEKLIMMTVMAAIGFLCGKLRLIEGDTHRKLSNLSLLVINPILIFTSYQTDFSPDVARSLLWMLLLTCIAYVIQIGLSLLLTPRKNNPNMAIERISLALSNTGFIGLPLVSAVFGSGGVIYLTLFIAVFNAVAWTYGVIAMTGKASLRQTLRSLATPSIFAVILGLALFLLRIRLPGILLEPLETVGSMNTPFAMIIAGATLAGADLASCIKKPRLYLLAAAKLLVIPGTVALVLCGFSRLGVDPMLISIAVMATGCSTAVMCTMFAHRYRKNSVYASELWAVTTILSVGSLPALMWFSDRLLALVGGL